MVINGHPKEVCLISVEGVLSVLGATLKSRFEGNAKKEEGAACLAPRRCSWARKGRGAAISPRGLTAGKLKPVDQAL
jgi:hypothetical protein